ncbi:tryptophanase leader peptide [Ursidibacter maritimus]|uniref:Tryptophanase leader peptide n=1 Tax=Ursidibacter maritimus TaxID=1331689 RepID=A0A949T1H3_9PAST|nr:tryptophanase leader peptide [Ursidibacter maritimus]MBV6526193.1 tryptophanase leader peptide [Ursidibacter maritimus]MBV6528272.1 tryptophanase leader peptide [Ursidibacter maritimus]MBV6529688.1 tryptophanase leader peptide [Ursidibacter maritimus]MBV6531645.1 tryptophanase leader peptide [Ursidibacter maritimus]
MFSTLSPNQVWIIIDPVVAFYFPIVH